MLLRMLVSQFVRQTAERKIYEEVAKVRRRREGQPAQDEARDDRPGGPPQEPPACEVCFVFALGIEAGGLVDLVKDAAATRCASFVEHAGSLGGRRVIVAESGVGREKAARATDDLIAIYRPAWIVSAGFAGALDESFRRGEIVMADHVVDEAGGQLDIGMKMDAATVQATKGLHVGRLLTVDRIIREPDEKRELGKKYNAIACDMETMAVADVCRQQGVRFLSVRVISDTVDDLLPVEIEKLMGQKSIAGKVGVAAGAFFRRPSVVKDMWKLKADAMKASDRLAKFLTGVVPQLVG